MRSERISFKLMRMFTKRDPREVIAELKGTRVGKAGLYLKGMVANKAMREVAADLAKGRTAKAGFYFNRMVRNKAMREAITNMKRKRIGKAELKPGASDFIDEANTQAHIDRLSRDGCTVLDRKLSQEKMDAIIRYSEQIGCYDLYRSATEPIDPKQAPEVTHVGNYRRADLVKSRLILDLVNDPGVLQVAQEFLGARPTISDVSMWWSFGGRKQAKHAQLFHRDVDDWKFCKLFIYLTDVTADSGPHVYVKTSSNSPALRKPGRYSDSQIEDQFGKGNVLQFIDTKGAAFMVDTYGFHKGLLPKTGNRLLLQAQYSLDPIGLEEYRPIKLEGVGHDPYINRLLYHS